MGRFVTSQQTKVIQRESWVEDDEHVTIRRWTVGQRDKMHASMRRIAGQVGEVPEVVIRAATTPVLIAGVKEWNFKDEQGNLVPVNEHWISRLDPDDGDFIAAEIYTFNGGVTEEEREQFFRGAEGSDANGGEAAA